MMNIYLTKNKLKLVKLLGKVNCNSKRMLFKKMSQKQTDDLDLASRDKLGIKFKERSSVGRSQKGELDEISAK